MYIYVVNIISFAKPASFLSDVQTSITFMYDDYIMNIYNEYIYIL